MRTFASARLLLVLSATLGAAVPGSAADPERGMGTPPRGPRRPPRRESSKPPASRSSATSTPSPRAGVSSPSRPHRHARGRLPHVVPRQPGGGLLLHAARSDPGRRPRRVRRHQSDPAHRRSRPGDDDPHLHTRLPHPHGRELVSPRRRRASRDPPRTVRLPDSSRTDEGVLTRSRTLSVA
jgi:hypothetical protein